MIQDDTYMSLREARELIGRTEEWLKKLRTKHGEEMGESSVAGKPMLLREKFIPWAEQYLKKAARKNRA